jgi:ankyrin repeat protein
MFMSPQNSLHHVLSFAVLIVFAGLVACPSAKRPVTDTSDADSCEDLKTSPECPEYVPEDLRILQTDFPGFVMPLERSRLTEQLIAAVENANVQEVKRMLQAGAYVDWIGADREERSDTRSPLFRAIRSGHPLIVEALLEYDAQTTDADRSDILVRRNEWGQTPLYFAVRSGNYRIIELLLRFGVPVNARNRSGKRPIAAAIEECDFELFELLIAQGAECGFDTYFRDDQITANNVLFKYPDDFFVTPFEDSCHDLVAGCLELAQRCGDPGIIEAVNSQFEAFARDHPHKHAEYAIRLGDLSQLKQLVENGYEPTEYPCEFWSSSNLLDWAVALSHPEIAQYLSDNGVKHHARMKNAKSKDFAMSSAIRLGSIRNLKRLIVQGEVLEPLENPYSGKRELVSPLKIAVRANRDKMVRFLLTRPEAQDGWLDDPDLLLWSLRSLEKDRSDAAKHICTSLIAAGANPDTHLADSARDDDNPLLIAARAGSVDVYQELAAHLPAKVDHGEAIQAAILGNHATLYNYLKQHGAKIPEAMWQHPQATYEFALQTGNRLLFDLLVASGRTAPYPVQKDVRSNFFDFNEHAHPLYRAALTGDKPLCERIIQVFEPEACWQAIRYTSYDYNDYNEYFSKGSTPLFAPVYGDHADVMQLLLTHGLRQSNGGPFVDIEARNEYGVTALHEAVNYGAVRCVQLLLAAGSDPNTQIAGSRIGVGQGNTPLHIVFHTPLAPHKSTHRKRAKNAGSIFALLVAAHIRNGDTDWLNRRNADGYSPLHQHAKAGNTENCLKLISLGADVNSRSDSGVTPLLSAIIGSGLWESELPQERQRRSSFCINLVEAGVPYHSPPDSPFINYYASAFRHGLFEFCKFLLEKGDVDPQIEQHAGHYLCSAIKYGRIDLFNELCEHDVDVNARDYRQDTPLHWAVLIRNADICERLLKKGADPNALGDRESVPLGYLFDRSFKIKRYGIWRHDDNEQDALRILKMLLEYGADLTLLDVNSLNVQRALRIMAPEFRKLIDEHLQSP